MVFLETALWYMEVGISGEFNWGKKEGKLLLFPEGGAGGRGDVCFLKFLIKCLIFLYLLFFLLWRI